MQIKTTPRYHLTPVRVSIINTSANKCWWRCGEREPWCAVGEVLIGAATVENSIKFSQKIKNGTVLWPSNSTSGYTSEETRNTNSKEYMRLYVCCSIIYHCQLRETAQVPINRRMDKNVVAHIYNGILLSHEKNEILPFATVWMDVEDIMLSELSQRKTNTIWFYLYVQSKNKINQ